MTEQVLDQTGPPHTRVQTPRRFRERAAPYVLVGIVTFAFGILVPFPSDERGPRPVGTSTIEDVAGDVWTHFTDLPALERGSADIIDIRTASLRSDGDELVLELELAGPARPGSLLGTHTSPAYGFEFRQGDRVIYSGTISVDDDEDDPPLHIVDRELWDDIGASASTYRAAHCPSNSGGTLCGPAVEYVPNAGLSDAGRLVVEENIVRLELDLDRFPRLLWGMTWSVEARSYLARGDDLIPHSDRAPDEGWASLPTK